MTDVLEDLRLLERILGGETLAAVGDDYGVTRESIRQRVTLAWHELGYEGSPTNVSQSIRAGAKTFEQFARRAAKAKPCAVCGYWILRVTNGDKTKTCSPGCAVAWRKVGVRWALDPEYRKAQQRRISQWVLAHPDKVPDYQVRYAQKILNGEPTGTHGRWRVPGSGTEVLVRLNPTVAPPLPPYAGPDKAKRKAHMRERYRTDPVYREKVKARSRRFEETHREERRAYRRARYLREKAERNGQGD